MNRAAFDIYVETQLAPTLSPGDVVILDNLSVPQSQRAADVPSKWSIQATKIGS
jgi:alpha-ketoglutarate-dependent taurine dioxygenase